MSIFLHGVATGFVAVSFLAWLANNDNTSKHFLYTAGVLALLSIAAKGIF